MLHFQHLLRSLPVAWTMFFVAGVIHINAQTWQWVERFGGFGDESFGGLAVVDGEGLYFAGSYEESFVLGTHALPAYGGADLLVAAADENGALKWTAAAGSPFDDSVAGLCAGPDGAVYCTGAFWQEAVFGEERIQAIANLKGIFLARYEPSGELGWVKAIGGTMLKEVTDVATDGVGNIYLAGFFQDRLLVDSAMLTARGDSDLFLIKFSKDGRLRWAASAGFSGDTRATCLALKDQSVFVGGYFNDTTFIAGQRLTANTSDRDVFIARFDSLGQAVWVRKAGGVHDDEVAELAIGPDGDLYAAGTLVGVMSLDENLRIESKTGQSDFYLLRYNEAGIPLMGRAMGGDRLQQASDLVAFGEGVAVSGFYQGMMTIDEVTVSAGSGFGSFIAHFDASGNLNWIKSLPTDDGAFITHLQATSNGALLAGGAFRGELSFDDTRFPESAQFDLFLGKLTTQATSISLSAPERELKVFPNPADGEIFLEPASREFSVSLFDISGRQWIYRRNERWLAVGGLPAGIYILRYEDDRRVRYRKVVIHH